MVKDLLNCCLYFTANSLARALTGLAEAEFQKTGLNPNYAFLLMLVCEHPGITQKEICANLQLTPSTITRFVDKLEAKGYVKRSLEGKNVLLTATPSGFDLLPQINAAWSGLHQKYAAVLGLEDSAALTQQVAQAAAKLESK
jgi:DNA-binding MarR family transcriptional regulator